jgi:hypothetical protein
VSGWRDLAACRGRDPRWWFPSRGESFKVAVARGVCAGCPVRADCAAFVVRLVDQGEEPVGVWAGVSMPDGVADVRAVVTRASVSVVSGSCDHGVTTGLMSTGSLPRKPW